MCNGLSMIAEERLNYSWNTKVCSGLQDSFVSIKVTISETAQSYCQRKGNGCHKEKKQESNGITIKDIKICCCDSDL